ncbi:MAG: hypothetical protein SPL42_03080 [Bacteroidales bacterium]|nr:hypothetical protein [Bacteroidales bacterium]MDY6347404.1 hypothetical protein [Bacteroidales bacterium]
MLRIRLLAPMRATNPRGRDVPLDAGAYRGMVQRTTNGGLVVDSIPAIARAGKICY